MIIKGNKICFLRCFEMRKHAQEKVKTLIAPAFGAYEGILNL